MAQWREAIDIIDGFDPLLDYDISWMRNAIVYPGYRVAIYVDKGYFYVIILLQSDGRTDTAFDK